MVRDKWGKRLLSCMVVRGKSLIRVSPEAARMMLSGSELTHGCCCTVVGWVEDGIISIKFEGCIEAGNVAC